MPRFLPYSTEQAYLLPPSVRDELGADHFCFFVHEVVERLDLRVFEQAYSEEGGELYHPALLLKTWLYGYAAGVTSARKLEQRVREDLGLRFLAGGARPDNWTLSAFRRRHARAINDSTRMAASASRNRIDSERALREQRARLGVTAGWRGAGCRGCK
jgi:transposase